MIKDALIGNKICDTKSESIRERTIASHKFLGKNSLGFPENTIVIKFEGRPVLQHFRKEDIDVMLKGEVSRDGFRLETVK